MFDPFIIGFDKALRTVAGSARSSRPIPGAAQEEAALSAQEKSHAGALMRVNHVGEVCAQALYQGQALTCRDPEIRRALEKAAEEETEHLAWTERRLDELGTHKSLLNAFWYLGAWSIGVFAGKLGEKWNLGLVAETERQVEAHLDHHLTALPAADLKSRAIVEEMKTDEIRHAQTAVDLGAAELHPAAKQAMRLAAGVMTSTAYYI
jgi:ubiquinone biosynthesis monooxygenase Coq7